MKKLYLCIAVLLSGCASQATASITTVMLNKTDDIFAENVDVNPANTVDLKGSVSNDTVVQSPEQSSLQDTAGFSTPVSPDDFAFYTSVVYNGIPKDAEFPSLKYAEGPWKYYLSDDTVSEDGTFFEEYGYADLMLDRVNNQVVITLKPALDGDGFELYEVTEDPGYEPFAGGKTEDGAVKLTGNSTVLYIIYYYAWQGRECISGEAWFSEEDHGVFIMTRGKE